MGEEKELFNMVIFPDKELGVGTEKERPCIIVEIDNEGNGCIVPLTSKKKENTPGVKQYKIHDSYINLNDICIKKNKNELDYAEKKEFFIDEKDKEIIRKHF